MVAQRVDADVDQQQHLIGNAGLQKAHFADGRQGQGDTLPQAAEQVEQLEFPKVAGPWMQRHAGAAVDHSVAMGPGQQFE
ncbi:hypothetical protein D9M73_295000 [compost metagenome]